MNAFTQEIHHACELLKQGNVVALPTETVYGLAGNALDSKAVNTIFQVKNRPLIDPLIVHIFDLDQAAELAESHPLLEKLAAAFWPGPLTLILPKKPLIPDLVTAGQATVALRMPSHLLFREVLKHSQLVLAAPSANPFGYISPSCAQHVRDSLGNKVPYILDGGPCTIGIESTILDLSDKPTILRPGPITAEALSTVLEMPIFYLERSLPTKEEACKAPGLLKQHYSPYTPLTLLNLGDLIPLDGLSTNCAYIHLKRPTVIDRKEGIDHFWLSETGNLDEAAQHLFALLRTLDSRNYSHLYLEIPPAEGIGIALRDRLKRAAARA